MAWEIARRLFPTIPERTIRRRATQQRYGVETRRLSLQSILSQELEDDLQKWIVGMQREGLPVTRQMTLSKSNEMYRVIHSRARLSVILGDRWVE